MTWKMRNPAREKAMWDYIKACKQAENAGRKDLIQKHSAYYHMVASEIYEKVSAIRSEIAQSDTAPAVSAQEVTR